MDFVYVNKNKLIPSIKKFSLLKIGLEKLFDKTFKKEQNFCKNVYLVEFFDNVQKCIYFSDGENIFKYYNDNILKVSTDFGKSSYEYVSSKLNNFYNSDKKKYNIRQLQNINNDIVDKCENIDNLNKCENTNNLDKVEIDEEKIRKKKELREMCDQVIEAYNKEKENMKKIALGIKKLEKEEKILIKKIRCKKIDNLSVLFYDLNSYNKIIQKINKEEQPLQENDERIPILFMKKFKYLKIFLEKYGDLCNLLLTINLNKLINSDIDEKVIDFSEEKLEEIFLISKIYCEDAKELNVEFSHSWEELDHDVEGNRMAP